VKLKTPATLPTITRKTLLYKSGISLSAYALNHVEGCSHGCNYPCYAMLMKKRFGAVASRAEWLLPKIVENTLELLDTELVKKRDKIERVFMCLSTDPFMYQVPSVHDLTLKVIARLNREDIPVVVLSKGVLPEILADRALFHQGNEYGATVVSLSDDFRAKFEPGAAPISQRIDALRALHRAGSRTWVSMEPYPPPNIWQQDIRELLKAVGFVDDIHFGKWNYNRNAGSFRHAKEFYASMARQVNKGIDSVHKNRSKTF
jgi:DNA repair photolyase